MNKQKAVRNKVNEENIKMHKKWLELNGGNKERKRKTSLRMNPPGITDVNMNMTFNNNKIGT